MKLELDLSAIDRASEAMRHLGEAFRRADARIKRLRQRRRLHPAPTVYKRRRRQRADYRRLRRGK